MARAEVAQSMRSPRAVATATASSIPAIPPTRPTTASSTEITPSRERQLQPSAASTASSPRRARTDAVAALVTNRPPTSRISPMRSLVF